MTLCVIAAVRLNRRASDARHLPNDRLLAPECTLTCARAYRVVHPKPLNWHEWSRFRSMLDRATVFGGREESSGKSRLKELGLPLGPRKRVLNAIANLKPVETTPAALEQKSEHQTLFDAERRVAFQAPLSSSTNSTRMPRV